VHAVLPTESPAPEEAATPGATPLIDTPARSIPLLWPGLPSCVLPREEPT
jgi:hypothetical protein